MPPQIIQELAAENDPRVISSTRELVAKLRHLSRTERSFDRGFVEKLEQVVYVHRARFKTATGTSFPPMAPLVLPSVRLVLFYRTDLSDAEIRAKLVQLSRDLFAQGVRVSAVEFAAAVVRTWPSYKPPIEDLREDPRVGLVLA
jgi:hypothetical protein